MVNVLSLDTETTTWNKGNPYDSRNWLVCYSIASKEDSSAFEWTPTTKHNLSLLVKSSDVIVGFNFKFDYHWLAKEGIDLSKSVIWDVQIAEFIISHQQNRMPSLDQTCERLGIQKKLDVVRTEYWDKGINTHEISWPILSEYAAHDAAITLECYYKQQEQMSPRQKMLCKLMCMDLHVLREMEATGLAYDEQLCLERSKEVDDQIGKIKKQLSNVYPHVPINFGSGDDLSAFLYGGTVKEDGKEHVGFYKTGIKAGQPKYKNIVIEHTLPRLFTPIKGSELAKEGMYATDLATLKKLKGNKHIIALLLELSMLEKKNGTYYKGLPKLREEMNWPPGILHGQFNQTVAQTGRLSSSKPNLQNMDSSLQDVFITTIHE